MTADAISEESDSVNEAFRKGYERLFGKQWPIWIGGLLLGIGNVFLFAFDRPWTVSNGVRNWGDWLFNEIGVIQINVIPPNLFSSSVLCFGMIIGALAAALLGRQFQVRMAPARELFKGLFGGALMGIGAALAFGCNIGGFFSAISALSMAGVAMMFGLGIGAFVGLKLLVWEIEYLPATSWGAQKVPKVDNTSGASSKTQPIVGLVILLLSIPMMLTYDAYDYPVSGGFLLFGLLIGMVMQRSRFCFVRAFRDPFMTGDAEATKAVVLAVIISVIGFTILKWTDLRSWDVAVQPGFWIGSLLGGIIFGIGMSFSGGCASGTIWRAGEGQVKLWVTLVTFALSTSYFRDWLVSSGLRSSLGEELFLPDLIGWKMALIIIIAIMFLWYFLAVWNGISKKLVVV